MMLHSTPEIYEAGTFLTVLMVVLGAVSAIVITNWDFFLVWLPGGLAGGLLTLPVWELSHLFGPVIAWAFVFATLWTGLLAVIAFGTPAAPTVSARHSLQDAACLNSKHPNPEEITAL